MKEGRKGNKADALVQRSWRIRSRCRMIARRIEGDVGVERVGLGRWDITIQ